MADRPQDDQDGTIPVLPCIKCGTVLRHAFPDTTRSDGSPLNTNQPDGGLEFRTTGHYGSTVFDPMNGSQLAVNICDGCLIDGSGNGLTLLYSPPDSRGNRRPRIVRRWRVERDPEGG